MRNLVGKLVVAGGVIASTLAFGSIGTASAACDPGLGAVLCPPPPTPAPPGAQPPPDMPAPAPSPTPAPAPSPAPEPEPAPAPTRASRPVGEAKARLVELINGSRAEAGLTALVTRDDLDEIAASHSADMAAARRLFHNDDLFTEATKKRLGAKAVGENVASNSSIDDAHRRLMASPDHRANLLSPSFTRLGLGLVDADGTWYLTQVFITPVATAAASTAPPVASATTAKPATPATRASTTRATSPRAARTDRADRPVASPSSAVAAIEATPDDAVVLAIDFATDGQTSSTAPATQAVPAGGAKRSTSAPSPFTLLALLLVVTTGLGASTIVYRRRTVRPISPMWPPYSWSTITPMSGS